MAGGLKAVAYTNVYQMLLLIFVSATLTVAGIYKVGGIDALVDAVPANYWNLFLSKDDPAFPWLPIILGYPIMGVWFWCTDQSMVQPVLAAKNLKEGQKGANFTGWLKILDVPLYILPGILCLALYPELANPDEACMVGLVLAVLTAALVSTIGSALNALSTVFTMDIYVKNFNPEASQKEIIRTGHVVTLVGALLSVVITVAIDSIKGLNLFNIFQSVLGFIAPPMAAVFAWCILETYYYVGDESGFDLGNSFQHRSRCPLFMGISCRTIFVLASFHDVIILSVCNYQYGYGINQSV